MQIHIKLIRLYSVEFSQGERQFIADSVEVLINRGILTKNKGQKTIALNMDMIDDIKTILNR